MGWEVGLELVAPERQAQLGLHGQLVHRCALQRIVEQMPAIAAQRLRLVQRGVGIADQVVGLPVAFVGDRDPDARRGFEHATGDRHRLRQLVQHAPGHRDGGRWPARPVQRDLAQQDHELVARQPCHQVGFTHAGLQATRDLAQELVAGQVPEAVVDDLEAVHVEVQQRAAPAGLAVHPQQRFVDPPMQVAAIGQAGQGVVHHLVPQTLLDAFALVDLAPQFGRALGHPFLQLRVRLLLEVGGAQAQQAGRDLRGDEGQQLLVRRGVLHFAGIALHRDHADAVAPRAQRNAQPAQRARPGVHQDEFTRVLQRLHLARSAQEGLAPPQHKLGQSAAQRPALGHVRIPRAHVVGELQPRAVLGAQGDEKVVGVEQLAHDLVDAGVELIRADVGTCELGDLEQCRLESFGALALHDFLLQRAVDRGQFAGARLDVAFEQVGAALELERGEDVAGHELQQSLVLGVEVHAGRVRLHHDRAQRHAVAQDRHAEPVDALAADRAQRTVHLVRQARGVPAQRALALQEVPGPGVAQLFQRQLADERGRVLDIDEIQQLEGVGGRVAQDDVEVLRVHQRADDVVDAAQHFGHVEAGHRQLGNGEQRALQLFGVLQALDLAGQVGQRQLPCQQPVRRPDGDRERRQQRLGIRIG
nr:hypothetical protein [Luteimonas granuli]